MEIRAYDELYLSDAMDNLGEMLDYAVGDCLLDADLFFGWFIASGIAEQFGNGNPKYIAGMNGVELALEVFKEMGFKHTPKEFRFRFDRTEEYWAGWALACYQWYSGKRFEDIVMGGLSVSQVVSMYILHEADISQFLDAADEILKNNKDSTVSKIKMYRTQRGFTQAELAKKAGVSLRAIQNYEQKERDINQAPAISVYRIARALGCRTEDLLFT